LLSAGSTVLGAQSAAAGASAQNNMYAQQSDAQRAEQQAARARLGMMYFGPQDYEDFMLATSPKTYNVYGEKRMGGLGGLFGGKKPSVTTVNRSRQVEAAQARFFGKYGNAADQMQQLNNQYLGGMEADHAALGRDNDQLDRMAQEVEGSARDNEAATIARTKYNLDRQRQGANQQATAQNALMGTSTLGTQAVAGNNQMFANTLADRMASIGQAGLANWANARNNRMNMLNQRTGMMQQSRQNLTNQRYQMGRQPIDQRQSIMGGSAFQAYNPSFASAGMSPGGSMMASIAPMIGNLGGQLGGQNGFGNLFSQLGAR
jgi:hypothetical protein